MLLISTVTYNADVVAYVDACISRPWDAFMLSIPDNSMTFFCIARPIG